VAIAMTEPDAPIPAPSQNVDAEPEPVGQDVTRRQPGSQEPDGQDVANQSRMPRTLTPNPNRSQRARAWTICCGVWPRCGAAMSGRKSGANSQAERSLPLRSCRTGRRHYTWRSNPRFTNIRSGHWRAWRSAPRYWRATGGSCGSFTYRVWTAKHRYGVRK
jgi:hypothetical protein